MEVPLINEELFKSNSPIKEDTVIDKFVPYILIAQKMYIKNLLGPALYAELQVQVKNNSLTPANSALIEQIAPPLAYYAVYQGLPFHWASLVNKGLTALKSENSEAVSIEDVGTLRRWLRDDANFQLKEFIEYLTSCRGNYPSWTPPAGCNPEPSKNTSDYCGFYIPKRRRKC